MNSPKLCDSKEKENSPTSSVSLPTPPDSARELSTSPPQSLSSSAHSLSQPAQRAFDIFKSIKQGHGPSENLWLKLRLEPGDYPLLEERLKVEDLWGYIEDKIRFDYNPQTCVLVFRMLSSTHEIFTHQVVKEIERQLQGFCEDTSRPDIAALASSIQCCGSTSIPMRGNCDQAWHSPDSSFQHTSTQFPALIIETSFSQKRKDLPRLADNYILGSYGNIKLVLGLDIEYRNNKTATVSMWESKEKVEKDGFLYGYVEKIVDNKPFRNDDSSLVASDITLDIPLSTFAPPSNTPLLLLPDAIISIPYTVLYSFLENAESTHQRIKNDLGLVAQQPLGKRWKWRQETPEEQLEDIDEARFKASEEKAERKAYKEDEAYKEDKGRKKT